jgi:hypothetical protein
VGGAAPLRGRLDKRPAAARPPRLRRLFGWKAVPDPTTFGRWLRRSSATLVPLLDELLWELVRRRWQVSGGTPKRLTLLLDSTVVRRYGQAGGRREGIQSAAAGPPQPSSAAGLHGRDGGLPGGHLASRECTHGRWSHCVDPPAGRAAAKSRRPGDHTASRQGLLLEGDGRGTR